MRLPLLAAVAAIALAGCQAGSEPGLQPADPTGGSATGEATDTTQPAEDPLRFFSSGGRVVYECFPEGPRRIMSFDQVRPRRPVMLTGVSGGGEATKIGRTWVSPLRPKAIPEGGAIDVDARGTQLGGVEAWADREPLRGAELQPGTTYTFFLSTTLQPDLPLDDFTLAWDDGTTTGESTFDNAGRTRAGGC